VRDVRCPACGEAFGCGADQPVSEPCWCTRVTLGKPALDALTATYQGCLCPGCLTASATSTLPAPSEPSRHT
jgi:hypothetical protein